jgi:hypothetical protein
MQTDFVLYIIEIGISEDGMKGLMEREDMDRIALSVCLETGFRRSQLEHSLWQPPMMGNFDPLGCMWMSLHHDELGEVLRARVLLSWPGLCWDC